MKIKAMMLGLVVSGVLSLAHADTRNDYDQFKQNLIAKIQDFTLSENRQRLVAMAIDGIEDAAAHKFKQEALINKVGELELEVPQLKKQLNKQKKSPIK
ncbi:hypothetical protein KVK52_07240 [Helicobacter pylori]|nr:hypothetical protein KVK52_07240 [Helicobacter pylori]